MSNTLAQKSGYSLSVTEQKIMLLLISKIKPTDSKLTFYDIPFTDYFKLVGISSPDGRSYAHIKKTFKALKDKSWWVKGYDEELGEVEMTYAWLDKVWIFKAGHIRVWIHSDMRPHLLELKKNFTEFELSIPLSMKSKYSIRLYELLRSYKNLGKYTTQLEYLQELLNADNYSSNTYDFFRWCLNPAVKEINDTSDLEVRMIKTHKIGSKKIVGVEFTIKEEMYPEIQMQMRADLIGEEA